MPASPSSTAGSEFTALTADVTALCTPLLTRVTGTHALLLDGANGEPPASTGYGRWTVLRPDQGGGWCGELRLDTSYLPFGDEAFCALLVRFVGSAGIAPEDIAEELARVLAPHGLLLVAELHPHSLWHPRHAEGALAGGAAMAPRRWLRALAAVGLCVDPAVRCGAPWPRAAGAAGLPRWLVRHLGGAYLLQARKRSLSGVVLRKQPVARRAVEHGTLVPGAHRLRA